MIPLPMAAMVTMRSVSRRSSRARSARRSALVPSSVSERATVSTMPQPASALFHVAVRRLMAACVSSVTCMGTFYQLRIGGVRERQGGRRGWRFGRLEALRPAGLQRLPRLQGRGPRLSVFRRGTAELLPVAAGDGARWTEGLAGPLAAVRAGDQGLGLIPSPQQATGLPGASAMATASTRENAPYVLYLHTFPHARSAAREHQSPHRAVGWNPANPPQANLETRCFPHPPWGAAVRPRRVTR